MRSGTGIFKKILGSVPILALGVAHLVFFFGLRVQMDGTGMRPIFYFFKPEAHYQALERNRLEQRKTPVPAPSSAAPAVEEKAEPVAETAAARHGGPASVPAAYWTDYRGPKRDGLYDETAVLPAWPSQGLPLLWRQPIGGGYASFVVAQGKAFTIEQRRHQEVVAAYGLETGRELWIQAWNAEFKEVLGGDGPRATPTWDEGRLYALGAAGELRCLDAQTGATIWSLNILTDNQAENLTWGMAASPLVVDDKVIVLPGGSAGKSVAAYNKFTGKPVWKSLNDKQAYVSPMLVTLAGRRQILVVSGNRVVGLGVEDGSLLWEYPWPTEHDINCAQPILLGGNRFFLSSGYGHGAVVLEVTGAEKGFAAHPIWENKRMKNKFNSSVLHQGHVYGLDEGILACVDMATGELKWKGGRYGFGQVLLAGGNLIVLSETGDLALVKAAPDRYEELSRFSALEGKTWNNPAIAEGRLLVRNTTEMACFRIAAR